MTTVRVSYKEAVNQFAALHSTVNIETLTEQDMIRMEAIMRRYEDAAFDFADVSIMAVGERLNITRIFTFDRRDFSIYRPSHVKQFELLP